MLTFFLVSPMFPVMLVKHHQSAFGSADIPQHHLPICSVHTFKHWDDMPYKHKKIKKTHKGLITYIYMLVEYGCLYVSGSWELPWANRLKCFVPKLNLLVTKLN